MSVLSDFIRYVKDVGSELAGLNTDKDAQEAVFGYILERVDELQAETIKTCVLKEKEDEKRNSRGNRN